MNISILDRWRIAIFAALVMLASGLAGLVVWWGTPHFKNMRNGLRWRKEMRAVVANRDKIVADWNRQFGPLDDFPKRHPATQDNEKARKLDAELIGMGDSGITIDAPDHQTTHPGVVVGNSSSAKASVPTATPRSSLAGKSEPRVRTAIVDVNEQLHTFLDKSLEQPDDQRSQIPQEIAEYLSRNADSLKRIRDLLTGDPPPVWRADYQSSTAPFPNLKSFLHLVRWLGADALAAAETDPLRSEGDLKAMAVLNRALGQRPETVSLLVAIAAERYRLGIRRKLGGNSTDDFEFAAIFDARSALREALVGEVWTAEVLNQESRAMQLKKMASLPILKYLPPPDNYMLDAFQLDGQRVMTVQIPRALRADRCSRPAAMPSEGNPAEWNVITMIWIPNMDSIFRRFQRYEMESEMTGKVIQLAQARAAATPGELNLPADFADSGCKTGHWLVEKSADGQSLTLRFSTSIDWGKELKGAKIPLQFSLYAPPNLR